VGCKLPNLARSLFYFLFFRGARLRYIFYWWGGAAAKLVTLFTKGNGGLLDKLSPGSQLMAQFQIAVSLSNVGAFFPAH